MQKQSENYVEEEGDSEGSMIAMYFTRENCRMMLACMIILDEILLYLSWQKVKDYINFVKH